MFQCFKVRHSLPQALIRFLPVGADIRMNTTGDDYNKITFIALASSQLL